MTNSRSVARALGVGVAIALLSGCSGGNLSPSAPGAGAQPNGVTPQAHRPRGSVVPFAIGKPHPRTGASHISPAAKGGPLLYVSDFINGVVNVYTWPGTKPVGTLYNAGLPRGMCTDRAHNIWITDGAGTISKFAHGGTAPVTTLSIPGYNPVACAVNPRNGDLAVTGLNDASGAQGNLTIFAHAEGTGTSYVDSTMYFYQFLGYDHKGNLYVDGQDSSLNFLLDKFVNGTFTPITVSGATINWPGGVQYVRGKLTVGDQAATGLQSIVYAMTPDGHVTGSTTLAASQDCVQYTIAGGSLVCPNAGGAYGPNVAVYRYAAGGNPSKMLDGSYTLPIGAAISK